MRPSNPNSLPSAHQPGRAGAWGAVSRAVDTARAHNLSFFSFHFCFSRRFLRPRWQPRRRAVPDSTMFIGYACCCTRSMMQASRLLQQAVISSTLRVLRGLRDARSFWSVCVAKRGTARIASRPGISGTAPNCGHDGCHPPLSSAAFNVRARNTLAPRMSCCCVRVDQAKLCRRGGLSAALQNDSWFKSDESFL